MYYTLLLLCSVWFANYFFLQYLTNIDVVIPYKTTKKSINLIQSNASNVPVLIKSVFFCLSLILVHHFSVELCLFHYGSTVAATFNFLIQTKS